MQSKEFTDLNDWQHHKNIHHIKTEILEVTPTQTSRLETRSMTFWSFWAEQWFSNLSWSTSSPAHFVCLLHLSHLIQLISSSVETARPEVSVSDTGRHTKCAVLGILERFEDHCRRESTSFWNHNTTRYYSEKKIKNTVNKLANSQKIHHFNY